MLQSRKSGIVMKGEEEREANDVESGKILEPTPEEKDRENRLKRRRCRANTKYFFSTYFFYLYTAPTTWILKLTRLRLCPAMMILFAFFMILSFIFAGVLYGLARWSDSNHAGQKFNNQFYNCIGGVGQDQEPNWFGFIDAFILSWTTFSTVGYGNVYPNSSSYAASSTPVCNLLVVVLLFEAFTGLIYAALAAGIIVQIVASSSKAASVKFSSVIVIEDKCRGDYGHIPLEGAQSEDTDDFGGDGNESESDLSLESFGSTQPFITHQDSAGMFQTINPPVLVFRIVNERWESHLLSSRVVCSCTRDHSQNRGALLNAEMKVSVGFQESGRQHVSSLRYHPIHLVMDHHPFFEATWYARHVLDHRSPLVKHGTRKTLKVYGGRWPVHILSQDGPSHRCSKHIRSFEKILVSLTGTEFDSGREVSQTHRYNPDTVILGASFAPMESKAEDGSNLGGLDITKIDHILIDKHDQDTRKIPDILNRKKPRKGVFESFRSTMSNQFSSKAGLGVAALKKQDDDHDLNSNQGGGDGGGGGRPEKKDDEVEMERIQKKL